MSFGENIKRFRRDKGLTQGDLSKISGIKLGHISKLERDESDPKLSTVYKLINALNCSAEFLLMDKKMGLEGVLEASFKRVEQLPDEEKKTVIDLIDKYCIACGMQSLFEKKGFLNIQTSSGPIDKILEK